MTTTATVDSIALAAAALLDAAEDALQTTDAGFTGQAFLNPGLPAFDGQCDFVCVWMAGEALASAGLIPATQNFRTGPRINLVTLTVTSGRCLHTSRAGGIPSVAEKNQDAIVHMQDGQALWTEIGREIAEGLFDGTCKQVTMQSLVAYTPQGGMGGWNLTLVVQIDGY